MSHYVSIQLQRDGKNPLYRQLYEKIREMIENGEIPENTKLPPVRKMVSLLGVNTATVVHAYKLLEQNGLVYSKQGSGTYVSLLPKLKADNEGVVMEAVSDEIEMMSKGQVQVDENTLSFASATPSPELFPVDDFKEILNEILERDQGYAFGYQESQGYYPLREAVSEYLQGLKVKIDPDSIHVISGAQQGIDILAKVLLRQGDTVFVESPTYSGAVAAFRSRGARIIEIPIEPDGISLEHLEGRLKHFKPKFIYTMPNFQNPTGYTYSKRKKENLLKLAARYNIFVVEDDFLSELDFGKGKICPLKAFDEEDRVIYIKSFSKVLMPGLRLAFLGVPEALKEQVLAAKHTSDITTAGLTQRALDLYLRRGVWQAHLRYMEKIYRERYHATLKAIRNYFPQEVMFFPPQGGLNFWMELPEGYNSDELYKESVKRKVIFVPGSVFYPSRKPSRFFRLSYAFVTPEEIDKGLAVLGSLLHEVLHHRKILGERYGFTPLL